MQELHAYATLLSLIHDIEVMIFGIFAYFNECEPR